MELLVTVFGVLLRDFSIVVLLVTPLRALQILVAIHIFNVILIYVFI